MHKSVLKKKVLKWSRPSKILNPEKHLHFKTMGVILMWSPGGQT